jgi:hypothetical protein
MHRHGLDPLPVWSDFLRFRSGFFSRYSYGSFLIATIPLPTSLWCYPQHKRSPLVRWISLWLSPPDLHPWVLVCFGLQKDPGYSGQAVNAHPLIDASYPVHVLGYRLSYSTYFSAYLTINHADSYRYGLLNFQALPQRLRDLNPLTLGISPIFTIQGTHTVCNLLLVFACLRRS